MIAKPMSKSKKRGCLPCGVIIFLLFILVVVVILNIIRNHVPSPLPEDQQKTLVAELTMPPGTSLKDGTAIVILVDVSGSMNNRVQDTGGETSKKIEIARRVTQKTLEAIQDYSSKNPGKSVQVALTRFGSHATEVIPMGPLNPSKIQPAIANLTLEDATAIGEAMVAGKRELNHAAVKKQFMIVITDGENTTGRAPEDVVKALRTLPEEQRTTIYLVAFDVQAEVFAPLVNQGIPVSEARDAKGLQGALYYILYEKILVEQE